MRERTKIVIAFEDFEACSSRLVNAYDDDKSLSALIAYANAVKGPLQTLIRLLEDEEYVRRYTWEPDRP